MAYSDAHTAIVATETAGSLRGRIEVALISKAYGRTPQPSEDQKEMPLCRAVIDGTYPAGWVDMVMMRLDTLGQLAAPTDAQIDTATNAVWTRLILTRG